MVMRDDFCAFILTHARPGRVDTLKTLERSGYTGKVYLVIDDEDKSGDEYRRLYGDKVLMFSREGAFQITDDGDNFGKSKGVVYARNVCWDLAKQVGVKYFIVLDDDYGAFFIRHNSRLEYVAARVKTTLNQVLDLMLNFYISTNCLSVAMSQGGDHIGGGGTVTDHGLQGGQHNPSLRRKAMNAFICSVDRQFKFTGHINEDVNAYVTDGRRGMLFLTVIQAQLCQTQTQVNAGGLTEFYLDVGTYVKSFYTVMYAPSCCKIGVMGDPRGGRVRIHHKINWHNTAPKILRESNKKCLSVKPA